MENIEDLNYIVEAVPACSQSNDLTNGGSTSLVMPVSAPRVIAPISGSFAPRHTPTITLSDQVSEGLRCCLTGF